MVKRQPKKELKN